MKEVVQAIQAVCQDLFNVSVEPIVTRPDEQFGDYATNVAMQITKDVGKPPREIADAICGALKHPSIAACEVAGPGFINISLTNGALLKLIGVKPERTLEGKTVIAEYSDPNPFKVLHAGHLYTSVVGDAIANLLEVAGGIVHRVNFGGDVGLHVAKTMYSIMQELNGELPEKLAGILEENRSSWMAECYVKGTNLYEEDETAKSEIIKLNKRVYELHNQNDHDSNFAKIYWTCRQWSYDYFDAFYDRIGTVFEKYYPESQTASIGLKTVREQLEKGIYQQSDGAVIFDGEKHGLHTRVFINSAGLPTYEAKDVGLIMAKWQDYHFDMSVIITGNDIVEYMKVVLKSIEQFAPELSAATRHITHGQVKLAGGVKMSSRKGNFLRAVDVLDAAAAANKEQAGNEDEQVTLAAVKYAFLKNRIGGDIIYDPAESVSLQGNSGPYLQYAHARACSILAKAELKNTVITDLDDAERSLVRKVGEYAEVVNLATQELMPHLIGTYLYELAQTFNSFYENNRIIGNEREVVRLQLIKEYTNILKNGLELLGIYAPERM